MSGTDFYHMIEVVFYLFCLWVFGWLFHKVGIPVILVEIAVGLILGPPWLDMIPYASDGTCHDFPDDCTHFLWKDKYTISIWQFIGNVGVTLMIMVLTIACFPFVLYAIMLLLFI